MKLDLRASHALPPKLLQQFNQVAMASRQDFVRWCDELAFHFADNLDWLFSKPATRNPHMSGLFRFVCLLKFLKKLESEKTQIELILVDSKAFYQILKTYFPQFQTKLVLPPFKKSVLQFLVDQYQYFVLARHYFLLKKHAKKTGRKENLAHSITLVDSFFQWDTSVTDHRYGDFQKFLTDEDLQQLRFVPKFRNILPKDFPKLFEELRARKYLLEHDYLKWTDYLYALLHGWRRLWIKVPKVLFEGFDLQTLLKKELFDSDHYHSTVFALLNHRFAKRLKESQVSISSAVNWFENQAIDKGWNAGFQKYYPQSRIIGYRGFYGSTYEPHLPSHADYDLKLLPKIVAVIGKESVPIVKTYVSSVETLVTPAIRNVGVWQERQEPQNELYQIFIAFSGMIQSSLKTARIFVNLFKQFPKEVTGVNVSMKVHPLFFSEQTVIDAIGGILPDSFSFVHDDIHKVLDKCHVAVACGRGTSAMDILARGCPLIVVSDEDGLFDNPIPEAIPQGVWKACHNEKDLLQAIQSFRQRSQEEIKQHQAQMKQIRRDYFEPVSKEGVKTLFFGEN